MNLRPPIFAPESELALIGAAMYAPAEAEDAFAIPPDQFGDPIHGLIWQAIRDLHQTGRAPLPEIVRDRLGGHPGFAEWGGYRQLWDLWDSATTTGLKEHVAAVRDRALRRGLKTVLEQALVRVSDTGAGDAETILAEVEMGAAELAHRATTGDAWIRAGDMVREAIAYARARSGEIRHPFGIAEVDDFTGGMNAGEMTILAARTGMGKTTGAQAILKANAARGLGVCFFSLEMAAAPLGLRLGCDLAFDRSAPIYCGVGTNPTVDGALKNRLTPQQWSRLDEASAIAEAWPLLIDTRPGLTLGQIEAAVRRQHRAWERAGVEPGPVIIDHLGKVRPMIDRRGSMHAEMADRSGFTGEMAKRLGVPVVALVQLNRAVEGREEKRPDLPDLRQAGELEEDARQVVFLYRPEYYLRDAKDGETFDQEVERKAKLKEVERKLYWIVGKNSHGPRGQVLTYCDMASSAIRSWQP